VNTTRCLVLMSSLLVAACGSPQRAGPERPGTHERIPSPAIASFDGEVIGVDRTPPEDSLGRTVRLVLRPRDAEPITVELAPGWYLEEKGLAVSTNERVRVRGRRTAAAGAGPTVVAWEVETQRGSWKLRDERGRPNWHQAQDDGR
jgi:hypothetical protein